MRRRSAYAAIGTSMAILGGFCLAGCGGGNPGNLSDRDRETSVILRIVALQYGDYLTSHGGAPPKDQTAFRKYLDARLDDLAAYNVKSSDEILTSPRDGQPLVIVCGKRIASPDAPESPWAAYEQTGVDGKRMAVSIRGGSYELTPEEFARQVPVK
jgi:hypothetical protein